MARRTVQYITYTFPLIPERRGEAIRFELDSQRRIARMRMPEPPAWIIHRIRVKLLLIDVSVVFHRVGDEGGDFFIVNLDERTFAELKSVLEAPRQEPPIPRFQCELFHHDYSPCGDVYSHWGEGPDLHGGIVEVFKEQRLVRVYAPNIQPYEGVRLVLELYKEGEDARQRHECARTAETPWIYDFALDPAVFEQLSRVLSNQPGERLEWVWTRE